MNNRTLFLLLAAALAIAGFCWWHWAGWQHRAAIGAGFAARVVCSCRHVEGRPMGSCETDLRGLPGMRLVWLTERPEERVVEAHVPLMADRSARAVPGFGCLVDPL